MVLAGRPGAVTLSARITFTPLSGISQGLVGRKTASIVFGVCQLSPRPALQSLTAAAPMRRDIVDGARVQQNAIPQECTPTPTTTTSPTNYHSHAHHSRLGPFILNHQPSIPHKHQ